MYKNEYVIYLINVEKYIYIYLHIQKQAVIYKYVITVKIRVALNVIMVFIIHPYGK